MQTEAIKNLLLARAPEDLANLYNAEMEVQVNVAKLDGAPIQGEYLGRQWRGYTNGSVTWKPFRIPYNARSDPTYSDKPMSFDLSVYAEGVGLTGWNWKKRVSQWVAFDFDAISGHSEKHAKKLTEEEVQKIVEVVSAVDYVELRKSTSGRGLHLYIFLPDVPTENHTEHAALARAILGKLSAQTGYAFTAKVDVCGGNMWVWHNKKTPEGLARIKKADCLLTSYPTNWRDHLNVISQKTVRARAEYIDERNQAVFEDLAHRANKSSLDEGHKQLMKWLEDRKKVWWMDLDRGVLVCHTCDLAEAHREMGLKGKFETISTHSSPQNCFAFPSRAGSWVVRRFTPGVAEHKSWTQDGQGWTFTYYNRELNLRMASALYDGLETPKDGFYFPLTTQANQALNELGSFIQLPEEFNGREAWIKPHRDGRRAVVEIPSIRSDAPVAEWYNDGKRWSRILSLPERDSSEAEDYNFDHLLRHVVTANDEDYGWFIRINDTWTREPLAHIKSALKSMDSVKGVEIERIIGSAVFHSWKLVKQPFQPEYGGGRVWNRNACQLQYTPTKETDNLRFPTWRKILAHIGRNLTSAVVSDAWCAMQGILTGEDYLLCWIASMIQQPAEPLPYLFLYGPQKAGKSILHEALSLLLTRGTIRADMALMNQSSFNAELENSVLCYVEEVNLAKASGANNRIKDWVTSPSLTIHAKGLTPYTTRNTTHWIQCANDVTYCPVDIGDTRITMIRVEELDLLDQIPKKEMLPLLQSEAPDFLAHVLALELPATNDRLNIPVVGTAEKGFVALQTGNCVDRFLADRYFYRPGYTVKFSVLWKDFCDSLDPMERANWTKTKFTLEVARDGKYVVSRASFDGNQVHVGNISAERPAPGEQNPSVVVDRGYIRAAGRKA